MKLAIYRTNFNVPYVRIEVLTERWFSWKRRNQAKHCKISEQKKFVKTWELTADKKKVSTNGMGNFIHLSYIGTENK